MNKTTIHLLKSVEIVRDQRARHKLEAVKCCRFINLIIMQ
jgi:hypothetical protein